MSCTVCKKALLHLRGLHVDGIDEQFAELLTQTVTLYWMAQMFKDHAATGVDDYVRILQLSNSG